MHFSRIKNKENVCTGCKSRFTVENRRVLNYNFQAAEKSGYSSWECAGCPPPPPPDANVWLLNLYQSHFGICVFCVFFL